MKKNIILLVCLLILVPLSFFLVFPYRQGVVAQMLFEGVSFACLLAASLLIIKFELKKLFLPVCLFLLGLELQILNGLATLNAAESLTLKLLEALLIAMGVICVIYSIYRTETGLRILQTSSSSNLKRYYRLFQQSPIGLVMIDANRCVLDINPYFQDMLGAPSSESIIGMSLTEQIICPLSDLEREKIEQVFIRGISTTIEIRFTSPWEKDLWLSFKAEPVSDASGQVSEVIMVCEEISQRKMDEEKIRYLSFHDSMTGAYNRAYLENEIDRLDTPRQLPLSVIVADLNGLKFVNDAFGHDEGDRLIKDTCSILKRCCREEDVVARWGGDEFIILLPQTSGNSAAIICERINSACEQSKPDLIQFSIATGIGTKAKPEENIHKILAQAEDMMYRNKLAGSQTIRHTMIDSLTANLQEKTHETKEHLTRMQELCQSFGQELSLAENDMGCLILLANLHDIGKINIPDAILSKSEPLSSREWEYVQKHPEIGYRIVYSLHNLASVAEEIFAHHERWDGMGYPRGLAGQDIPLLSRVLAIVDAYEVMTHDRPYKSGLPHHLAVEEIKRCAGNQFDPDLVEVFCSMFKSAS